MIFSSALSPTLVGHTPLQVVAGVLVGAAVGFLYPLA